jgi:hypothetical protein
VIVRPGSSQVTAAAVTQTRNPMTAMAAYPLLPGAAAPREVAAASTVAVSALPTAKPT